MDKRLIAEARSAIADLSAFLSTLDAILFEMERAREPPVEMLDEFVSNARELPTYTKRVLEAIQKVAGEITRALK